MKSDKVRVSVYDFDGSLEDVIDFLQSYKDRDYKSISLDQEEDMNDVTGEKTVRYFFLISKK